MTLNDSSEPLRRRSKPAAPGNEAAGPPQEPAKSEKYKDAGEMASDAWRGAAGSEGKVKQLLGSSDCPNWPSELVRGVRKLLDHAYRLID